MHTPHTLARAAALTECCLSSYIAAAALQIDVVDARRQLDSLLETRHLRASRLPGFGNQICYQPTPKAAGFRNAVEPFFLRSNASSKSKIRGLMRGQVRFIDRPELSYLSVQEQSELLSKYRIPARGFPHSLVGLDGAHFHIFVPMMSREATEAGIELAVSRWLNILDSGCATLHFSCRSGDPEDRLNAALRGLKIDASRPSEIEAAIIKMEAKIADDRLGFSSLELQPELEKLERERLELAASAAPFFPWLGDVYAAR